MGAIALTKRILTSRYSTAFLLVVCLAQGYMLIRPRVPELDPERAAAADRTAIRVAEALGNYAGDRWSSKYVRVARIAGDQNDEIRNRLEAALYSRTNCRQLPDTLPQEVRDEAADKAARVGVVGRATADRLRGPEVAHEAQARALLEPGRADVVVFGELSDFRVVGRTVVMRLVVRAIESDRPGELYEQVFSETPGEVFADGAGLVAASNVPVLWRLFGWSAFVMLLPMVTAGFWTRLLDAESSAANAASLAFLTLLGASLAWALLGFTVASVWSKALLAVALIGALTWNLFLLALLERRRVRAKLGHL